MKKKYSTLFFATIIMLFYLLSCQTQRVSTVKEPQKINPGKVLMDASARLGIQAPDGGEVLPICQATAISKEADIYEFLTAAHCVGEYNPLLQESIPYTDMFGIKFVIVFEAKESEEVRVFDAELVGMGKENKFEDVAVLKVKLDSNIEVAPLYLGDEPVELNEDLFIISEPVDLKTGNLYIRGYVSKEKILVDRYVEGINIKGSVQMQVMGLGVGRGSSGSLVNSVEKGAAVGVISTTAVNSQGHVTLNFCPINKFFQFYARYKAGNTGIPKTQNITNFCDLKEEGCMELIQLLITNSLHIFM